MLMYACNVVITELPFFLLFHPCLPFPLIFPSFSVLPPLSSLTLFLTCNAFLFHPFSFPLHLPPTLLRKEDDDWVKKCMEYEVEGPRPKKTWREVFKEDSLARKLNKEDTMDRSKWRKLMEDVR